MGLRTGIRNWLMREEVEVVPDCDSNMKEKPVKAVYPSDRSLAYDPINDTFRSSVVTFRVFPANGGFVVETHSPNPDPSRVRSEDSKNLHIIRQDEDIGEAIGRIITMECLRR